MIETFCRKHNIELVDKYIDEALSGTSDSRQAFQQMIQDSENAKWAYILVYNISRLARNVEDQMFYQKILKERGVMVVSVEEKFDSSPEGNLFSLITAGINEYYSKHLAKRSFAGVLQNAQKGLAIGGKPPLGYDVDKNKRYIINKKEAEAVRILFEKYAEGWSLNKISIHLNEQGYRTKHDKPFTQNIQDMLRNRKYIGEYVFNQSTFKKSRGARKSRSNNEEDVIRIPNAMPRIIDDKTFEAAQQRLNKGSIKYSVGFRTAKYLLSGLLRCGNCHYAISGCSAYGTTTDKPDIRYSHTQYRKRSHPCDVKEIPTIYLDNWIKKVVMPELLSSDNFKKVWNQVNETIEKKRDIDKLELREIKQEIRQRETAIERKAIQSARSGFALFMVEELETLKRELNPQKKRKQHLETEIAKLKRVTVAKLQKLFSTLKREWEQAESGSQQHTVIHMLLHNIIITNDKVSVFIHYHTLTANPVDSKIEVASVKRDLLFKMWKRYPESEKRKIL